MSPSAIDPESKLPPYVQLADHLRGVIAHLMDGELLPSASRLQAEHGVGRGVVRNALRELAAEGLVVVEPGIGTFKRPRPAVTKVSLRHGDELSVRSTTAAERRDYAIPASVAMIVITRTSGGAELYPADRTVVIAEPENASAPSQP